MLGKKLSNKEDGGFIVVDISDRGSEVVLQSGIEVE